MKIYYTSDAILDQCNEPCPCDKKFTTETGLVTRVGSYNCTHDCPMCYGRSRDFCGFALFAKGNTEKPFVFREDQYVKCAGVYSKLLWYNKLQLFWYKYIGKYIMDGIDKFDKRNA